MRSIKAIIVGSLFVVVMFLILQLAYLFMAIGYNSLAAHFPFLKDIAGIFRYLIALPVLTLVMFIGGYITADIANMHSNLKIWFHCFTVGFITVGSMMYSALQNSSLTLMGVFVIIVALFASSSGGFYWLRGNRDKAE